MLEANRGIVVLGDPGAGKTTLLKYLAVVFAADMARERLGMDEARLPILVPLAAYGNALENGSEINLFDFLPQYYKMRGLRIESGALFKSKLETGEALILFDGLDEIVEIGRRREVARHIMDFYDSFQGTGNRFVITSRIVGYEDAKLPGTFAHYILHDFRDKEIEDSFLKQYTTPLE